MTGDRVRTAEVVGSFCMATDLGMALPFGHGLGSTVVAMRLADSLGVDRPTAVEAFYGCLLFYAGCTADADMQAGLFPDGLSDHWTAVMFASQRKSMAGVFRALGAGEGGPVARKFTHWRSSPGQHAGTSGTRRRCARSRRCSLPVSACHRWSRLSSGC